MQKVRISNVICSTIALCGVMAASASGLSYVGSTDPTYGKFGLGVAGDNGKNTITISIAAGDAESYLIEDPDGVVAQSGCISVSTSRAACVRFGGVNVGSRGGDDIVRIDIPFPGLLVGRGGNDRLFGGRADDRLRGGTGADMLRGRAGPDRIFGDEGRDRLIGGPGRDMLKGGPKADVFRGGSGNDELRAIDNERDRVIDCGPGKRDIAYIDRGLDPEPIGCERVKYGRPG